MKSIKEYCTKGMSLYEREELARNTIPVPIGETVFLAGDAFDYTKEIIVTPDNQMEVSMFWNSLYFEDRDKADYKTFAAHAEYGRYQASVWS